MKTVLFASALAGLASVATAALTANSVEIRGSFPPENKFGIVLNGEPNKILLKVSNLAKDPLDVLTIKSIESEFREIGGKERLLRKNKPTPLKGSLKGGDPPSTFPYLFSSELKEGNVNLRVWVDWTTPQGLKERTLAYDSTVTISEPPTRWLDPQLILLYLIIGAAVGFGGYTAYRTFISPPKKKARRSGPGNARLPSGTEIKAEKISTPKGGSYEADWIPQGHIRTPKGAGSGAESGGETSGAEGKARWRKR